VLSISFVLAWGEVAERSTATPQSARPVTEGMGLREPGRPPTERLATLQQEVAATDCGLRSSSTYGDEIGDSKVWKACTPPGIWLFT
jgi:hypothetical protein